VCVYSARAPAFLHFFMIRRPQRSTPISPPAASDVDKKQAEPRARPGERLGPRLAGPPTDDGRTEVTLTYDWAAVTHPAHLVRQPVVAAGELDASLTRLATVLAH
ncbi:hypothetical protein PV436_32515, partial [Streptomyces sp. ME12-02E]|nr:hypothetical protein [Streptomyces sp. ME12-02E]